ncbi:aminopeptidase M1 isoform X4 [Rosa chinensis]|uniref:aminopeptidase M1 isoform X4 n=1 Tax=Rosa chinensis TaxID=74649 RepID=UPI001AD9358F|nr:aminopeptidase M1 isoform X4 [Rosa chinensis]
MFIKFGSPTLTAKSTTPAMLFWMEMMKFLFWYLIKHLVLVRESWGLTFLQSLMRTWWGYINVLIWMGKRKRIWLLLNSKLWMRGGSFHVGMNLLSSIESSFAGVKVSAYCPVGKSDKGEFALNVTVMTLDLFSKYFSTPYSLPKLDMVAVPEFSGGAMENYGLITYRETELLFDPLHSTAARKQRMAIVVSHEVAHQWFGNLVTMEWWTDLWLNEGFATWISYMATDILFPEWKVWSQFLQYTTGGLIMDALEQSHPIQVEVHHARSVLEIFDAISYEKGSAVIRMLQAYLGDDIFQKSLSSYIKRYSEKNAKTEDLWSVLSEESGLKISEMMDDWTKKQGYPVISVTAKDHILEFEQTQFLSAGLHSEGKWIVPVTISLGSYERRKNFLLETKSSEVDISDLVDTSDTNLKNKETCDEQLWVKVNIEQSGFYRVKYEDKLAARLRKAIEHNSLEATDKFGILDDAYALCEACELSLSSLLSLMDVYRKEADYIVLSKLIDVCYNIVKVSSEAIPDSVNELKQFCIKSPHVSIRRCFSTHCLVRVVTVLVCQYRVTTSLKIAFCAIPRGDLGVCCLRKLLC